MAPIRSHTKSRKGCKTCKKRKVKCDESGFPRCSNCTKRELDCDWPAPLLHLGETIPNPSFSPSHDESSSPAPESSPALSTSFTMGSDPGPSTSSTSPMSSVSSMLPSSSYPVPFDMSTLELLHQYSTQTCFTIVEQDSYLGNNPILHAYQVVAPRLALSYPFLMHSILALAALHLGSRHRGSTPTTDYHSLSRYHIQQAKHQSVTPICPDGTCLPHHKCAETASALFLAKLFLNMHSFMDIITTQEKHSSVLLDSLVDWIQEQRVIVTSFFNVHHGKLSGGPLAAMLSNLDDSWQRANQASVPPFPPSLLSLHVSCAGAPDDSELSEYGVSDTYKTVVNCLEYTDRLFQMGSRVRALILWASIVPNDFIQLLRQKRPRALILLAHFCSLYQDFNQQEGGQPPSTSPSGMQYEDVSGERKMHWWMRDVNDIVGAVRSAMPNESWTRFLDATLLEGRASRGMKDFVSSNHQSQHLSPSSQLPMPPPLPTQSHRYAEQRQLQQRWDQNTLLLAYPHPLAGYASGAY